MLLALKNSVSCVIVREIIFISVKRYFFCPREDLPECPLLAYSERALVKYARDKQQIRYEQMVNSTYRIPDKLRSMK